MFLGEMLCLATFYAIYLMLKSRYDGSEDDNELTKGSRSFNRFILLPPAAMDVCATSLMYLGLAMTNASSFQMLRGSVIVFVALLSLFVLKRKILVREWIGIALIIVALVIVGASDIMASGGNESGTKDSATPAPAPQSSGDAPKPVEGGDSQQPAEGGDAAKSANLEQDQNLNNEIESISEDLSDTMLSDEEQKNTPKPEEKEDAEDGDGSKNALLGDFIIIFAQIITACQMVYEELFVVRMDIPPLEMVGYEGVFGLAILSVLLIPLNFIPTIPALENSNAGGTLEDTPDAFSQIGNNALLFMPIIGLMLSIAFYNYAGISLTKEINATTRMVLDSIRMIVVWVFALSVGWQTFHWMQIVGFIFLMAGMCVYNNIIVGKVIERIKG